MIDSKTQADTFQFVIALVHADSLRLHAHYWLVHLAVYCICNPVNSKFQIDEASELRY